MYIHVYIYAFGIAVQDLNGGVPKINYNLQLKIQHHEGQDSDHEKLLARCSRVTAKTTLLSDVLSAAVLQNRQIQEVPSLMSA